MYTGINEVGDTLYTVEWTVGITLNRDVLNELYWQVIHDRDTFREKLVELVEKAGGSEEWTEHDAAVADCTAMIEHLDKLYDALNWLRDTLDIDVS